MLALAGGLMLTHWAEFPYLLPFTIIGGTTGMILVWLVARVLGRRPRPLASAVVSFLLAVALALPPADLHWAGVSEPRFRAGVIGGFLAVLIAAGVAVALLRLLAFGLSHFRQHSSAFRTPM
jgi:hypothetical protein